MKHSFDYYYAMQPMDSFEVEDISEFTLDLFNDIGQEWMINISTDLGDTEIKWFGPFLADINSMEDDFKFSYNQLAYNEGRIIKKVDQIINNSKNQITQIQEIDKTQFNETLKEIMNAACE